MTQRLKIIAPWAGRSMDLVSRDYPDELIRYAGPRLGMVSAKESVG